MPPTFVARLAPLAVGALAVLGAPALPATAPLAGQDVAQLGRIHGTTPPDVYFRELARNPRAYQFSRAWMARNPRLRLVEDAAGGPPRVELRTRPSGGAASSAAGVAGVLGRRDGPVEGTFRFPLLLGYYADMAGPPGITREDVQREFFDGPSKRHGTITDFYDEMSGGRVVLQGVTFDWVQSPRTASEVTGGTQGLWEPAQVGGFIKDLLEAADAQGTDWGQFDNDGPDGIPNSADDDGFVDLLTVFHPTGGAECNGGNRVWSHKWSLREWQDGQPYTTSTPSNAPGGGYVKVDDYTIQPVYDCSETDINQIGVFAHELGHGFGLPDLYCTFNGCGHEGIGRWGLMGSGSWGCGATGLDPARPCPMSAWSKYVLQWAEVDTLPPGQDLNVVLGPASSGGHIALVEAQDGSGEYFLLENRVRQGFDLNLFGEGLLVWHVDPAWLDTYWPWNTVNNNSTHLGVWLRQADGLGQLENPGSGGNRGDAGDPFPGATGNPAFHAGSVPQAYTHGGDASGLTLLDIERVGDDVAFRALTRFQTLTVRTVGETTGGLLAVDGVGLPGSSASFASAPFQNHLVEAAAGEPLGPGRRRAFAGWTDDAQAPRERLVQTGLTDAVYEASYGEEQVQLDVPLAGGRYDVAPGTLVSNPASADLWFAESTVVSLQAVPTPGFAFTGWTGALAGQPNPAVVTMDGPVAAGASFEFTYALPAEVEVVLEAAAAPGVQLTAPQGTAPFQWSLAGGALPLGVTLLADGRMAGHPMAVGTFPVQVRVVDARGLQAVGGLRIEVDPPALSLGALAGPFTGSGAEPSVQQRLFLDGAGNGNGYYDLGDLRAFLRAHPTATGASRTPSGVVVVPLTRVPPGGAPEGPSRPGGGP